jgi:transcriptional regulator NrdR family protein
MTKIIVVKRGGETENFDVEKLRRVALATGLNSKQADKLVDNINKWAGRQNDNNLTTLAIRQKIIEELGKIRKYSADKYIWYENLKDKHNTDL